MTRDLDGFSAYTFAPGAEGKTPLFPPCSSHRDLWPCFGELGNLQLGEARSLRHGPHAEKHGLSFTVVPVLPYLLSIQIAVIKLVPFTRRSVDHQIMKAPPVLQSMVLVRANGRNTAL